MSTSNQSINIKHSERARIRVLIVDVDQKRSNKFETKLDLDPYLQRIDVFFVNSLFEARDFVKSRRPEIAIFPESLNGMDFVSLQGELKNAHDSIKMIPLVESPTLAQFRESRRIGGVIDFESPHATQDYSMLRDLIVYACREISRVSLESDFNHISQLQKALLIQTPERIKFKNLSSSICAQILSKFDLNYQENLNTLLAEKLYLPELTKEHYTLLLKDMNFSHLIEYLDKTSTWKNDKEFPMSVNGTIITAANFFAHLISVNSSIESIIETFQKRPVFLKHVSIRTINDEVISEIYFDIVGGERQVV